MASHSAPVHPVRTSMPVRNVEIAIEPQEAQPELGRARAAGRVAGAIAEILHVVDVEADEVPDAVREQQREHAVGDELDRVAAQDAEIDEAHREGLACEDVDVAVARAG